MESRNLQYARRLRSNMTDAERFLWKALSDHRLPGFKFRRQQPVVNFIFDFICFEARLIIELDGGQHNEPGVDTARSMWLAEQGFRILRFWNHEVFQQTEALMEKIIQELTTPSPQPLSREGRGEVGAASSKAEDHLQLERLRWRCRRGLLELDLVLVAFIEQYPQLDASLRAEFDRLLDMPDTLLWDAICGRIAPQSPMQQRLLARINKA